MPTRPPLVAFAPLLWLLLLLPTCAFAALPSGVFRGHIGGMQVYACLEGNEDDAHGQYYYQKHRKLIDLSYDGELRWHEGDAQAPSGVLQLARDGANLTGSWSHADKKLPVQLEPIPRPGDDNPACASDAFHKPRELAPKLVTTQATFQGVKYEALQWLNQTGDDLKMSGMRLLGGAPTVAKVNALLLRDAPDTPARIADYYDCVRGNRMGGQRDRDTKPVLLTPSWLVVEEADGGYCGSAHPFESLVHTTYDLRVGQKVDVWRWFDGVGVEKASAQSAMERLKNGLHGELNRLWRQDKSRDVQCVDAMDGENPIDVAPTATGLAFTPQLPHVIYACTDTVEMPYVKAVRFLNTDGKKAVAVIRAEAGKLK